MPNPSLENRMNATRRRQLLDWYRSHQRDLPWRRTRTLYGTWISEIMLQQTTVATVIPYYEKFLATFPDVHALAAASEDEVLSLWTGLGYYRRARHLLAAARSIVHERGGEFPGNAESWRSLPGIGEYAAGAIASQALGEAVPAVDANARRVLSRWVCDRPEQADRLKPRQLQDLAADLVPEEDPGSWNEAVMELGATLCRPRQPRCDQCPVLDQCAASLAGNAEEIPPAKPRAVAEKVLLSTLVIEHEGRILLTRPDESWNLPLPQDPPRAREETSGLHQGLHGLPVTPWYADLATTADALADPARVRSWVAPLVGETASSLLEIQDLGTFAHAITRYRLKVRVWHVRLAPDWRGEPPAGALWSARPRDLPLSHLVTKSLARKSFE